MGNCAAPHWLLCVTLFDLPSPNQLPAPPNSPPASRCLSSELPHGRGAGLAEARQLPPAQGGAAGAGARPGRRHQQHPGADPAGRAAEEGARAARAAPAAAAAAAAPWAGLPAFGRRPDAQHPRGAAAHQGGVARVGLGGRRSAVHRLGELVSELAVGGARRGSGEVTRSAALPCCNLNKDAFPFFYRWTRRKFFLPAHVVMKRRTTNTRLSFQRVVVAVREDNV